jgi:hypothetical protein
MRLHEWRQIGLTDALGQFRVLRGCPESSIPDLRQYLDKLYSYNSKVNSPDRSVRELYREDFLFRQLCDIAIGLVGLDSKWFTIEMISELIFPYERDGKYHMGLIEEVSFPIPDETLQKAAVQVSWEQRQASIISVLISTGLATDFNSAYQMISSMSVDEIQILIDERVKHLDPKAERERAAEEAIAQWEADPANDPTLNFKGMPMFGGGQL